MVADVGLTPRQWPRIRRDVVIRRRGRFEIRGGRFEGITDVILLPLPTPFIRSLYMAVLLRPSLMLAKLTGPIRPVCPTQLIGPLNALEFIKAKGDEPPLDM
jgi:hypothetical protein